MGVRRLFTLGVLAQQAAEAFGGGAEAFQDLDSLIDCIRQSVQEGIIILVKGSRSMRMERVIEALRVPGGAGEGSV